MSITKLRIFIVSFLLLLPVIAQSQDRPETLVIPVSSLGEVTEIRKEILQNTLEDELKMHFRLISQERFEEAQEKAFEELEYEECTEDQCIIMIQEMLQVENVFHLQVISEGKDTQLSLNWRTLDERKKEEEFCEGCSTGELRKNIISLVSKLMGKTLNNKVVVDKKNINESKDSIKNNEKNTTSTIQASDYNTSYIGLSFIYPMQYPSQEKNVKGLRINFFGAYNESVNGLDMTLMGISGTKKSKLMQITGIGLNFTNEMDGIQAVGGGINYSSTFATSQIAILGINYAETTTFQFGLSLNAASKSSFQIGIVNFSEKTNFQIGLLNFTKYLDGIQIGFLNIVMKPTASYGYVLPFFNASF